jgi:hypothetical protein
MKTAQQIAAEITDAILEFEQHHEAAGTAMKSGAVDTGNLDTIRESKEKHIEEFLGGNVSFVKANGEPLKRKDVEQHIAGILANKTQDEVDTFLQQLHNDVNSARTLNNHIGK